MDFKDNLHIRPVALHISSSPIMNLSCLQTEAKGGADGIGRHLLQLTGKDGGKQTCRPHLGGPCLLCVYKCYLGITQQASSSILLWEYFLTRLGDRTCHLLIWHITHDLSVSDHSLMWLKVVISKMTQSQPIISFFGGGAGGSIRPCLSKFCDVGGGGGGSILP
jgi:hypothetical protein